MEEEKRQFKGIWIPAELYKNKQISWEAKVIWLEVNSFTGKDNYCFFSNDYLAEHLGCSDRQVKRYLTELKEAGLMESWTTDGRRFLNAIMPLDGTKTSRKAGQKRPVVGDKNGLYKSINFNVPNEDSEDSKESSINSNKNNIEELSIELPNTSHSDGIPTGEIPGLFDGLRTAVEKHGLHPAGATVYQRCVEHWLKVVHPGWSFKAVDGKAMKGIIKQMEAYSMAKRKKEGWNENILDDDLVKFFQHFCQQLSTVSRGFYKTATLTVLNSKFDGIIEEIKTAGTPTRKLDSSNPRDTTAIIKNIIRNNTDT